MDGVGTAANLIAVINLAIQGGKLVFEYIQKAKNYRQDINKLYRELISIAKLNKQAIDLKTRLEQENDDSGGGQNLAISDLSAKAIATEALLDSLIKTFEKRLGKLKDQKKAQQIFAKLKWGVNGQEFVETVEKLKDFQESLQFALQIDTA